MNIKDVEELVDINAHWDWLEPLLIPHYSPSAIVTMKYLYTTAMAHGIKHAIEAHNRRPPEAR